MILGDQREVVYVRWIAKRWQGVEISPQDIYSALASKNLVANAGRRWWAPSGSPSTPPASSNQKRNSAIFHPQDRGPGQQSLVYLGECGPGSSGLRGASQEHHPL